MEAMDGVGVRYLPVVGRGVRVVSCEVIVLIGRSGISVCVIHERIRASPISVAIGWVWG